MDAALLEIDALTVEYAVRGAPVPAVRAVSLRLQRGGSIGLVGESGCGKSTLALAMLGLVPPPGRVAGGTLRFEGRTLTGLSERDWRRLRGERIAIILQDPTTALNPVWTIGAQLAEMFRWHRPSLRRAEMRRAMVAMLDRVGIAQPERRLRSFPHELSGGMRQRVAIACALILSPALLVADEPTTALDVTVQAQILDLIRALRTEHGTALMLISHDLGVVAEMCDLVAVMYAGRIVEFGPTAVVLRQPRHPYTQGLLSSRPSLLRPDLELAPIPGTVPDPAQLPAGCAFRARCKLAEPRCAEAVPPLHPVAAGHAAACVLAQ